MFIELDSNTNSLYLRGKDAFSITYIITLNLIFHYSENIEVRKSMRVPF